MCRLIETNGWFLRRVGGSHHIYSKLAAVYTVNRCLVIATLPTQEQVDRIADDLAPDVARIRLRVGRDWSDGPALYFRVILSDEASRRDRLADVTERVRKKVVDELRLDELEPFPYFKFRSQSEQAKLHDPAWD
jgi:hypothetical protein